MGSAYDPEAGVLRLRHATLSVLARLAVAPADAALHDHDVAPLVAELRGLGILTPGGIAPPVEPLARAIGEAAGSFTAEVDDHGTVRRFRGWSGPQLGVVAAQVPGTDDFELMADTPAMLPALVEELLGVGTAPEPAVPGVATADATALAALLARGSAVTVDELGAVLEGADAAWSEAFTAAVRGAALRWQLRAGGGWMEVLDAGRSGLWLLEPAAQESSTHARSTRAARTVVRPVAVEHARARLRTLLATA